MTALQQRKVAISSAKQVLSIISVLDELCMGSQAYDATEPDFHDDISSGSMQLAHIGNGVSVESPSPNYMEDPASPSTRWNHH